LSNIASTPSLTSHQFARNSDRYTQPKPRLSKPKSTNYVQSALFTPSLTLHGFPTLYPSTKNRAPFAFAPTFVISITHVQKTIFQCPLSIKLSMTAPDMRLFPLWTDSLAITKFKFTQLINIKLHSLPRGVHFHIVSCPSASKPSVQPSTASRNCDQSRSCHRTSIITVGYMHTKQSPISAYATIQCIKKTHFLPFNLASEASFYHPQPHTHAHLFTIQARTYARLFYSQVHS
jgi:hypothetical protein